MFHTIRKILVEFKKWYIQHILHVLKKNVHGIYGKCSMHLKKINRVFKMSNICSENVECVSEKNLTCIKKIQIALKKLNIYLKNVQRVFGKCLTHI